MEVVEEPHAPRRPLQVVAEAASEPARRSPVRDADELGDTLEPLLVEITHGTVAKNLPRREQSGLRVHLVTAQMG